MVRGLVMGLVVVVVVYSQRLLTFSFPLLLSFPFPLHPLAMRGLLAIHLNDRHDPSSVHITALPSKGGCQRRYYKFLAIGRQWPDILRTIQFGRVSTVDGLYDLHGLPGSARWFRI